MRADRVFLLFSGVFAFATACAYTLNLVYQLDVVGLNPLQLVLVGTTLEVVCLLAQVPTGLIADLYSRRLSVVVGVALIGSGVLLEGLVPHFVAVLVGTVISGVGITCVDGAIEAWAADETGEAGIGRLFTRGGQLGQLAGAIGIGAAVGLATVRLNLPLVVAASAFLALCLLLVTVMPERHFTRVARADRPHAVRAMGVQVRDGIAVIKGRPVLTSLLAATAFLALGSEGFDRLGQAHFLTDIHLPGRVDPVVWLGGLSAVAMVGSIGLTEVVRRTGDLHADRIGRLYLGFQVVVVAAILGFAVAGQFWLAVLAWLAVVLLRGACGPLARTWLVGQTESATRATVLSFAGMVDATGQIVGGPPVGLIGQRFSIPAAIGTSGVFTAPAIAFLAVALARQRPERLAVLPVGVGGADK